MTEIRTVALGKWPAGLDMVEDEDLGVPFSGPPKSLFALLDGNDGLSRWTGTRPCASDNIVYAIAADFRFPRARGESHILYVGHGTGQRVLDLESGRHSCSRALWMFGARRQGRVEIRWRLIGSSQQESAFAWHSALWETLALHRLVDRHGEPPPCNLRWEGFFVGRLLEAMVAHVIDPVARKRPYRCYDWGWDWENEEDTEAHNSTWCPVTDALSLGWYWPAALAENPSDIQGCFAICRRVGKGPKWKRVKATKRTFEHLQDFNSIRKLRDEWGAILAAASLQDGSAEARVKGWLEQLDADLPPASHA